MEDDSTGRDWFSEETATFGDRLAAAREAMGLSQKELAQGVGIKTSVLRGWEEDLNEPRVTRLSILAGILGVSFRWLLTGEGKGVDVPVDGEETAPDVTMLLTDLRAVRAQLAHTNERLAQLEKRLRAMAKS